MTREGTGHVCKSCLPPRRPPLCTIARKSTSATCSRPQRWAWRDSAMTPCCTSSKPTASSGKVRAGQSPPLEASSTLASVWERPGVDVVGMPWDLRVCPRAGTCPQGSAPSWIVLAERIQEAISELQSMRSYPDVTLCSVMALLYAHKCCETIGKCCSAQPRLGSRCMRQPEPGCVRCPLSRGMPVCGERSLLQGPRHGSRSSFTLFFHPWLHRPRSR